MNLLIGEKIRKLRRERNLTQEEVAAHLGISFQAISKWERGDGYPDITMLPALASYFRTTVDDLLGVDEIAAKQQYDEINAAWKDNRAEGRHAENVSLMRDALKRYPNDALLLMQLCASLEKASGTPEEKRANLLASIAAQQQILEFCEDSEIRSSAMFNICFSYHKAGQIEKAIEQAKKLTNLYQTRETALVYFLEGEERRELAKSALEPLAWAAELFLNALGEEERAAQVKAVLEEVGD